LKISTCRLCQSPDVRKAVDLGFHPLADTFLPEHLQLGPEVSYPLHLGSCQACGHVFTLYPVTPEDRYQKQDYSYDSSNSKVAIAHFKEFCDAVVMEKETLAPNALIVDIGSNVGTLLSHFKDAGFGNVLGVEPSGNISRQAVANGVPTINDFFNGAAAIEIVKNGQVEVLLSSNVVNHADDIPALLKVAQSILSPTGIFVFEVPYLLDLIQRTAFDTIYHEHVHYYGLKPLAACLERAGFSIFKVERLEYMCGSIRVYARVGGQQAEAIDALIAGEDAFGLYTPATYEAFMERVEAVKSSVNTHLWKIRSEGGKIIGIGAATKGNTFLNYCKLDSDLIAYIADASPLKIGKRTPGSHIPIIADDMIDADATHALILPWNIADFLVEKLAHLGVEFYVPQVAVLDSQSF
jgi:SAM-dependent methyltransferase